MSNCNDCATECSAGVLKKLGINGSRPDFTIALAGNPNTGKSTVFNALTGLRQHTGNWPGKTITRAEGSFTVSETEFRLIDLPGTYSLLSTSQDEEVARNFILFEKPDVTVIVVDATALERNLNLVLQVLQITPRAVLACNLMDEAKAHAIAIDLRGLSSALDIPVVGLSARSGSGLPQLLQAIQSVAAQPPQSRKPSFSLNIDDPALRTVASEIETALVNMLPELPCPQWIALRLLEGDRRIIASLKNNQWGTAESTQLDNVLKAAESHRWQLDSNHRDQLVESLFQTVNTLTARYVNRDPNSRRLRWQAALDRVLTGKWTGFPVMGLMFAVVLWLTISGANVPSAMLADLLIGQGHPLLHSLAEWLHFPFWLKGVLIDGAYLAMAWVISVMLPPMAIFFPLFTLLEDFGYLPRVAFNLDHFFQKAGAHGKQALTMAMGYGCNAAGIIATRIIESPREKLIAILTNNFALCNGRWPTQILIATLFIGSLAPAAWAGIISALAVFGIALLGIFLTFFSSWLLSRTVLKGEASVFTMELPPFRPPNFLKTLYTSLIDRTLFVLWRAIVFAFPAGIIIWLLCNLPFGNSNLATVIIQSLDPLGLWFGLSGVILLAYILAIPANEIVVPTILMLTVLVTGAHDMGAGSGVLFETDDNNVLRQILTQGGWTTLTGICLMLFSLCHNPCSTTLYTIYKETQSWKWTIWSALMPTAIGLGLCLGLRLIWQLT
jgi:ferrous iron transport protein B